MRRGNAQHKAAKCGGQSGPPQFGDEEKKCYVRSVIFASEPWAETGTAKRQVDERKRSSKNARISVWDGFGGWLGLTGVALAPPTH